MVQQLMIVFSALVAVASAVVVPGPGLGSYPGLGAYPGLGYPSAPVYPGLAKVAVAKVAAPEPYDANPQYSFSYDVHDSSTGDVKNQQETRSGDVVQGSYSLIEADGTRRIVEYTADPVHGFNAVVHREGAVVKAAKVLAPAPLLHAPVVAKVPAYGHAYGPALAPAYGSALAPAYHGPTLPALPALAPAYHGPSYSPLAHYH